MSDTVNSFANEDYLELEVAYNEQSDETGNVPLEEEFKSIRLKDLIKRIDPSNRKKPGIRPFLAAVELDLERSEPIGVKELFLIWLEKGNKYWLNPMDKQFGFGVLQEILFKFMGDVQILAPFIKLLIHAASNGISPRSFAEFVILPRMRNDNDWRKWHEKHYEALRIIFDLINNAKDRPPFNQEYMVSGQSRLARDIVLVRYLGRPLACYPLVQLCDEEKLELYLEAWQKISLHEPLSLYFIRSNALNFIYNMSGQIDLVQLVAIIEQLPEIEQAFSSALSNEQIVLKNLEKINLYGYDIDDKIKERKVKGFHKLDFTTEIKAYFNIVRALLEKLTGVYLLAWYAGLLKSYKNSFVAETIYNVIRVIGDRGGMHIYKWHTRKLLKLPKNTMQAYVTFIEENGGCDPDYPRLQDLFRDEETFEINNFAVLNILRLADNLNLNDYFNIDQKNKNVSYSDLLKAYEEKHPDSVEIIEGYQQQVLSGQDRQWTQEYINKLDNLSPDRESLYNPLLHSIIRGVQYNFKKADNFSELFEKYGNANSQLEIAARTRFNMQIKNFSQVPPDCDALGRKQINLILVERIWNSLTVKEEANVNNTLRFINKWSIELNEALDKAFGIKFSLEDELNRAEDTSSRKKQEQAILKQEKAIKIIQDKKQHYTEVMKGFDSPEPGQRYNEPEKFIVALILAGAAGKDDEEYLSFIGTLLLQRYRQLDSISSRLKFLEDDINVNVLTYQQFIYLLNLMDTLFFVLREDTIISQAVEEDTFLKKVLSPYIITKNKEITMDAIDAAAKKTLCFAALQNERAKWQEIIENKNETLEKNIQSMEIYTSKSFIDAYYGDMGGICLSQYPKQILRPGFYVQRLVNHKDKRIIGISILALSRKGFSTGYGEQMVEAQNYWHAFAFNPLSSVLRYYSLQQQLYLYLQFRLNMEKVAFKTKMPIVLSGIDSDWGLISNNQAFGNLIRQFELERPTVKRLNNAFGYSIMFNEASFAQAALIIDPRGYDDPLKVPSFYAYKSLYGKKGD